MDDAPDPNAYLYLRQAAPGLLFGITNRFQEIKDCVLSDCDCITLKVEMFLIHVAFLFGYASPRRFIWQLIKYLLRLVSTKLEAYFAGAEVNIITAMSLVEQIGLTYIWDYVRDSSICMRYHNCDNDFLAQISNIKIKFCNVQDISDDSRQLSTCEKVFNDSPLILMAIGMVTLSILTSNIILDPPPVAEAAEMPGTGIPPPPPRTPSDDDNKLQPANHPISFFHFPLPGTAARELRSSKTSDETSESAPSNSSGPIQNIHSRCPNCKKTFDVTVPKPWPIGCDNEFPCSGKKTGKKGSKCRPFASLSARKKDEMLTRVINEVFSDISCCKCKELLKKKLQALIEKREKAKKKCIDGKKKSK